MKQKNELKAGFKYLIETVVDGKVIDTEETWNLIPTEGLNNLLSVWLKSGIQSATHYIGIYEGNYTPVNSDTAATFTGLATESTAYSETARVSMVLGSVASGAVDNTASPAEFTGTTDGKIIRGGFISTSPSKGSTTGTLISAVRFSSSKTLDAGTVLRVTCSFQIVST